jgi:beta-galactosidase/beta-glucuronidase
VDGQETDRVESYFGMRKVSIEDGRILLNNRPYMLKMVLDQGYFPDGILTAPSDDALRRDIELTKEMGFNGARKHQKIEDPRYLYWADRLGLLVWGEMANACAYSEEYVERVTSEWQEAVHRDYNHPCIMAWVPLNESWGVPNILVDKFQQQHALAMYHLTRSLDDTRLVISNDGWEHVKSDICTIHDYESKQDVLDQRYATVESAVGSRPAGRWIHVPGFPYEGAPIVVSEYGGISFKMSDWEGWGYSAATSAEDFIARYRAVTEPMIASPHVQGFCYTQLTDVEQEINGLLTYDRKPKVPLEQIKAINDMGKMRK